MFSFFRNPIQEYFVNHSLDILKPTTLMQPHDEWYLNFSNENKRIIPIKIKNEERELYAHKLQLLTASKDCSAKVKKVIVYMPGNHPCNDSLPEMEPLLKTIMNSQQMAAGSVELSCVFQHYRGRGVNQLNRSENFHDYSLLQDAKDQAALIQNLVEDGYEPKNILVLGYSYGSAIGIWAIYHLINKFDAGYMDIKFFSDRGFGNLFNAKFLRPLILNQDTAHQELSKKEVMPEFPLQKIIAVYLPEAIIFALREDQVITEDFSLAEELYDRLPGRVFIGETPSYNPHLASRSCINLRNIPEVKPSHFITAMLTETPLELFFLYPSLPENLKNFSMGKNPGTEEEIFIKFPAEIRKMKHTKPTNALESKALEEILINLYAYCGVRAKLAQESRAGKNHTKNYLGGSWIGWTVEQQIKAAIEIMFHLVSHTKPNIDALLLLQNKKGPHRSGELQKFFANIMEFISEYKSILAFNDWVVEMPKRRELRARTPFFVEENPLHEWVMIEEKMLQENMQQSQDNILDAIHTGRRNTSI